MKKLFHISAHQPYPFSPGRLNATLTELAVSIAREAGYEVRQSASAAPYSIEEELEKHQWADLIILQSPINWMGVPWSFKKYMDEVYSAGMNGSLCKGDGRSSDAPKSNYGAGGMLTGTRYMLSLTFNAPEESFKNESEYLFSGRSVDDLLLPMHMNFRFFGMTGLDTFACYDVMKDPHIEEDLKRFRNHLDGILPGGTGS